MLVDITGKTCVVNSDGDLFMDEGARPFIGKECAVIKALKSGLIQVALKGNPKMLYNLPKRNLDFIEAVHVRVTDVLGESGKTKEW